MKTSSPLLTHVLALGLALMLTACGNQQSTSSGDTASAATANTPLAAMAADAYTPPAASTAQGAATSSSASLKARDLSAAPTAVNVYLGAPDANKLAQLNAKSKIRDSSIPLQTGFERSISQASNPALTKQLLNWKTTASGGKVAAISFSSSNAKGLRIGLLVTKLPESATLRFYAKGAATAYEVKGAEILGNLARNLAAGDTSDAGRTYWSPKIGGAESTVEIELPAGVSSDALEIAAPSLSHFFLSAAAINDLFSTAYAWTNQGLSCEVDVTCSTPLPPASNAVAVIDFQDGGTGHSCSGTLIADATASNTPYFLTANHCVSNQTAASTVNSYWFYRSASCNATNGNYYLGTTSATLLFTTLTMDGTLLLLNQAPPAGVMFAGWDATTPPTIGTVVSGIHHPELDAQRISGGSITNYSVITSRSASGYTSSLSDINNSTLLQTNLLTESGSSGSSLMKNITTSNPQVIGQLLGGPTAVCGAGNRSDYGRFDKSFNAGFSDWLSPLGNKPVHRFYNTSSGTHFYTINVSEKTYLQTNFPSIFSYEGTPFKATKVTAAGLSPVHRFYNLNLGVHFYTISEPERAWVVANLPQMRYEGIAWYAQPGSGGGTIPLYRFYNRDKGVHFYTVSAAERASVIVNLPQMNDEGIAYYVLP